MGWLTERFGIVRVRQLIEDLRHRLSFLPIVAIVAAVVVSQITLSVDRGLGDVDLPAGFETSVESSRVVFATIAGALITTVTLLLSMMLVAIQLASSNFSPRTLRNWLADSTLRWSIAIALGTTVFCLMALPTVHDGDVERPTVTLLGAVVLALLSLIMVISAVDHVAGSMQVGTVANRLVASTLHTLRQSREAFGSHSDTSAPTGVDPGASIDGGEQPTADAVAIESPQTGFIQQIDEATLCAALPDGARVWLAVSHGDYVTTRLPLAYVSPDVDVDRVAEGGSLSVAERVVEAFAIGETRTMQQDVGLGVAQLSDIAVRALSSGINDPETASGIVLSMGEILRAIWSLDPVDAVIEREGRTIHRRIASHADMLRLCLDPIRRYGRADADVMTTMALTVGNLLSEVQRCELPGPVQPLVDYLADIETSADAGEWLDREVERLHAATRRSVDG